jgi:hypothetical protein
MSLLDSIFGRGREKNYFSDVYVCFAFRKPQSGGDPSKVSELIKKGEERWLSELTKLFQLNVKITNSTITHFIYVDEGIEGLDEYLITQVPNNRLLSFIAMVPVMGESIQDSNKIKEFQNFDNVSDLLKGIKYFGFKSTEFGNKKGLLICVEEGLKG